MALVSMMKAQSSLLEAIMSMEKNCSGCLLEHNKSFFCNICIDVKDRDKPLTEVVEEYGQVRHDVQDSVRSLR